ncbi:hypothetical protein [Trebonia sp.]|uniref:hypothetical protein n=1 Tax=Trebonia sp. TaxID=2767075 RepID=UPI002626C970|nr:hypothetical protein [Trebonia sp.]
MRSEQSILVLGDPLVMRPRRLADRVLARAFGGRLDGELAAGAVPESSVLRAARAQEIVSLRLRREMAGDWDHLLRVACANATDERRLFICADRIAAAAPAIRELTTKLVAPLPVRARGVAMASVLLTDAAGPVYNENSRLTLAAALAAAISQLDPALPLTDAA